MGFSIRFSTRRTTAAAVAAAAGLAGLAAVGGASPAGAAAACPTSFSLDGNVCVLDLEYAGKQETFTLPSSVGDVTVEVAGASADSLGTSGGKGGKVRGVLKGAGGKELVFVIGAPGNYATSGRAFGGGGAKGVNAGDQTGGGGTFLGLTSTKTIVAAAGGGGGNSGNPAAVGGNGTGAPKPEIYYSKTRASRAGTSTVPPDFGTGPATITSAGAITPGLGGNGGDPGVSAGQRLGGGGGGGYFGGDGGVQSLASTGGYGYSAGLTGSIATESTLGLNSGVGYIRLTTAPQVPAATAPGSPTGVSAVAGAASATVSWTPPASDGGSPITKYVVVSSPGMNRCETTGPTQTSCVVPGLTPGTSYTFQVGALNSVGGSVPSAPSAAVTPLSAWTVTPEPLASGPSPYGPNGVAGAAIVGMLGVPGPVQNAEQAYQWQVSTDGTAWTDVSGASGVVRASAGSTSSGGPGGFQITFPPVPPPPVRLANAVQGSYYRLGVTYKASGYPDVTKYSTAVGPVLGTFSFTVTPSTTAPKAGLPLTAQVSDATQGDVTYSYQWIDATANSSISGATSASFTPTADLIGKKLSVRVIGKKTGYTDTSVTASAGVVAKATTVPGAPTGVQAVAGDGSATVSWLPPVSDGGTSITQYTVTVVGQDTALDLLPPFTPGSDGRLSLAVPDLINGQAYTFTVTASNAEGVSAASEASVAVTPAVPAVAPQVTTQPKDADVMDGRVAEFTVEVSGTPVPTVTWERSLGNGPWTTLTTADSATLSVTGSAQVDGARYRAVVTNSAGTVRSEAATLRVSRLLRAPQNLKAVRGDGTVSLTWAPPSVANNPQRPTGYVVVQTTAEGSKTVCLVPGGATLGCTVEGLTNGKLHTFSVAAVNGAGAGRTASVKVVPLRAVTFTAQPESVTVAAGGSFSLSASVDADPAPSLRWEVKGSDGKWRNAGSAVTGTSSTLTEKKALLARSGWQYRLKVSQPGASVVYSRVVTVTVTR
ncbi:fibronectin type III domain-containing protein [Nocardioides sp.]|uniref:fibronectin type III domain-containing protein n=1 Tax=Nocardioides sp. TaxID=35761 RepID=UPI0035193D44